MARLDTRLESEGAEFLVLGHLLVEGLQAHKTYTNMPGYDVLVVNPKTSSQQVARVSVKSRWRIGATGFIIKNFDSDFVVVVKLNREKDKGEVVPPEFFIIPTDALRELNRPGWGRINFGAIPNFQSYKNEWHQIRDFVGVAPIAAPDDEDLEAG